MAAITSSDVTYTIGTSTQGPDSRIRRLVTVAFGDGVLTYPTGGVPLVKASMGCPTHIESVNIVDSSGNGYLYKYDLTNNKMLTYYGDYSEASLGALLELPSDTAPVAASIVLEVIGY